MKIVLNECFGGFELSQRAMDILGVRDAYAYVGYGERTDARLISCVEQLGEEASGELSNLVIEEFDSENYLYEISEEDGCETLELQPIVKRERLIECKDIEEMICYIASLGIYVV